MRCGAADATGFGTGDRSSSAETISVFSALAFRGTSTQKLVCPPCSACTTCRAPPCTWTVVSVRDCPHTLTLGSKVYVASVATLGGANAEVFLTDVAPDTGDSRSPLNVPVTRIEIVPSLRPQALMPWNITMPELVA